MFAVVQIEARIRVLENKGMGEASAQPKGKPDAKKYDKDRQGASGALLTPPKAYNTDADVTMTAEKVNIRLKTQYVHLVGLFARLSNHITRARKF